MVKPVRSKPQYKPPEEKMNHRTSYSTQFTAESAKPALADNKFLEHRRIRTLYSEPCKEASRVSGDGKVGGPKLDFGVFSLD